MKNLILLFSFIIIAFSSVGQSKSTSVTSGNCFKDWYSLFKERGANTVPDGTNDVIISIRNGDYSECFMGKIDVAGGVLNGKIQVQKIDGSYGEFDKSVSAAYMNNEGRLKEELRIINGGMTASVPLTDGEVIRLFFYKSLKDKAMGNKKAPSPSQLIKN